MIRRKGILVLIFAIGITLCVTPLLSQSKQKQDIKLKVKKPMVLMQRPDLQVDKVEISDHKVKVWIKNTGLVNAPGPHIKARFTMAYGNKWTEEKSIINRVGQPGAIIPTKKPADRAYVTFDATGKVVMLLHRSKFTILLDSTNKVKELNEKNNTYVYDYFGGGVLYK